MKVGCWFGEAGPSFDAIGEVIQTPSVHGEISQQVLLDLDRPHKSVVWRAVMERWRKEE